MITLNDFRNQMSVAKSHIYFNHAAIGPISDSTLQIIENVTKSQRLGSEEVDWEPVMTLYEDIRKEISQLINSSENEIALTNATALGISHILSSMDWSDSKNKGILINELEFTSNSFAYQQISKKFNIPLHVIKSTNTDGIKTISIDDIKSTIENSSTSFNLIGISHVQFLNGHRIDLQRLSKMAHEYGIKILVDAMQSVGAISVDVRNLGIDYLATGGYKWCLGPFSTGFLYINEKLVDSLEPVFVGPTSDKKPLDFQHHDFHPHDSALKFQGAYYPSSIGLGESIKLLNSVGINNIETKILSLVKYLSEQLINNISGITIKSPMNKEGSGILTVQFREHVNLTEIQKKLSKDHHISISVRSGGLRFSPHGYNTEEEIDILIKVLKTLI